MKLPNGYGSVYKLSGRRRKPFIARKTVGWDDDGRQIYATIGYYPTRQEALQALAAFNDNPYDLVMSKTTFADIYQRWFDETFSDDSNRSTRRNYEAAYKQCAALYDMKMADIRPHHMQQVLDSCPNGYESTKRIRILFNKLYRWCMKHDCIKRNYAEALDVTASSETKERTSFTTDELNKLWSLVGNNEYVSIVLMLIYSGVRISELLDLKKEDVDLQAQCFRVRASKTESGIRTVPIADKVLPFWQSFMDRSICEYAVCNINGKHLTYDNFKLRYWKPLMSELNMQHTPHETRHTCISLLVARNINQTIIKKIVGHKSIMNLTEKVYTHIEIKELLDAINKI